MTRTFEANGITLERERESVWKMAKEGGMRVPGRILASEPLLEQIADDKTLHQLQNTTYLPGIVDHAICMPDGHQGYGFPVGGVAGIDAEDGCISPGAVGYDINCLVGTTDVLLEFGRRIEIKSLAERFETEQALVADGSNRKPADIQLFTETGDQPVYAVETVTGHTITATADHPIQTPEGMTPVRSLEPGDSIHLHPFTGIEDEAPPDEVILDRDEFDETGPDQLDALQKQGLLPLHATDSAFHRLLPILGYCSGCGGSEGDQLSIIGSKPDLEEIREDLRALGFSLQAAPERDQSVERTTGEPGYRLRVTDQSLIELLEALGLPRTGSDEGGVRTPAYLETLADWQIGLYLSGIFGAALTWPDTVDGEIFQPPAITAEWLSTHHLDYEPFLRDLQSLLARCDIDGTMHPREGQNTDATERPGMQFEIGGDPDNLISFFSSIGYRYGAEKQRRAMLATAYLNARKHYIEGIDRTADGEQALADGGTPSVADSRQADPSRSEQPVPSPPADQLPISNFDSFCENRTVRDDFTIETEIRHIRKAGDKTVYDIGVSDPAHNFIANGFVVSNCGVRMMRTNLHYSDVQGREEELVDGLFERIPSGLGGGGVVETDVATVNEILDHGMEWALDEGYAVPADLEHCEDEGARPESDAAAVSQEAKERGAQQIGSLGSGNHFLEVQRVTDIFLDDVADAFGLEPGQVVVLIHCGSRGLGHQVCTDYLRKIEQTHAGLLEKLPDKELAAAPAGSQLAESYYMAMGAAINFAWVNRQLVMHRTRTVFENVFNQDWESLGLELLYDVAHNIAKKEVHSVAGEQRELYVHRKGATRAFPAGHDEVPAAYRTVGQPIIIPGSMGAGSYVLRGGDASLDLTFGSTAHGAGRVMSRTQAKREYWGGDVQDELREGQQVYVKAQSGATIAEEAPGVYKDVDEVVRVSDALGIGDMVARTFPICNIKG